jgi:hypothetical protein
VRNPAPAVLAVVLLFAGIASADDKPVFLRRVGADLWLRDRLFRIVSVNKFDLAMRFLRGGEERAQAEQAIADAAAHGFTVIRASGVGYYPADMTLWPNQQVFWERYDDLMATCRKHGVRLILTLNWNLYLFPDMAGECVQDMLTDKDSRSRAYLWLWTSQLVSRYRDNDTVLFWELSNEVNLLADLAFMRPHGFSDANAVHLGASYMRLPRDSFTTEQMIPYLRALARFIRSLDPNHLISTGAACPRPAAQHLRLAGGKGDWTEDSEAEFETYLRDTNPDPIDIISIHYYPVDDNSRWGNQQKESAAPLSTIKRICDRIGKPMYLGETGDKYGERPAAPYLAEVLRRATDLGIPITLIWNWQSPGDDYNVSPEATPAVVKLIEDANRRFGQ